LKHYAAARRREIATDRHGQAQTISELGWDDCDERDLFDEVDVDRHEQLFCFGGAAFAGGAAGAGGGGDSGGVGEYVRDCGES